MGLSRGVWVGTLATMFRFVVLVLGLAIAACSPPSTTAYQSCGSQSACLGGTQCAVPDAGANGTCLPACTRSEECPRTTDGKGTPTCAEGRCRITCGVGTELGRLCPAGMTCVPYRSDSPLGSCEWP